MEKGYGSLGEEVAKREPELKRLKDKYLDAYTAIQVLDAASENGKTEEIQKRLAAYNKAIDDLRAIGIVDLLRLKIE
jgi:hypothetical protein